jgi:hypothetical protein
MDLAIDTHLARPLTLEGLKRRWRRIRDAVAARHRGLRNKWALGRSDTFQKIAIRRELKQAQKAILSRLTRLEFARWSTKKGRQNIKTLKIAQRVGTPSALYFRLDTVRMPRGRGITTSHMSEEQVLYELSLACGAPVTAYRHYRAGFWLTVERANGIGAIPRYVEYSRALMDMPQSAGPLDIPLGYGINQRFYHVDITDMPHLLVAGATGFGKSIFLATMLATVGQRSTPDQVKMVLIDLKGGASLGPFSGLPHLWDEAAEGREGDFLVAPQVYTRRETVLPVLKRLYYEMQRRMQLFNQAKCRDRVGYNRKNPHRRLPLILVVADEIQNVMLDRSLRHDVESSLVDVASMSRAAGIHLVIATQRPSADVLTGLIKANFPTRLSFNVFSGVDSRVILDQGDAAGLGRPGLLVYKSPYKLTKCQGPYISDGLIGDVVTKLAGGDYTIEVQNSIGTLDTVEWAIAENDGKYTADAIYKEFRPRGITYEDARELLQSVIAMDEIRVGNDFYRWRARDSRLVKLREAAEGEMIPVDAVTFEEIARWAIEENECVLSTRDVFDQFEGRASHKTLHGTLIEHDGEFVLIRGRVYQLINPGAPRPRELTFHASRFDSEGEIGDLVHIQNIKRDLSEATE